MLLLRMSLAAIPNSWEAYSKKKNPLPLSPKSEAPGGTWTPLLPLEALPWGGRVL